MKEVKKFKGTLVERVDNLIRYDWDDEGNEIATKYTKIDTFGIIGNFDEYKENYEILHSDVTINKLQDNVTLYNVDIKNAIGDLANLCNIRNRWAKGIFDYREYLTKQQIKELLEKDYLVAVQGLQEINLEDLDKLD